MVEMCLETVCICALRSIYVPFFAHPLCLRIQNCVQNSQAAHRRALFWDTHNHKGWWFFLCGPTKCKMNMMRKSPKALKRTKIRVWNLCTTPCMQTFFTTCMYSARLYVYFALEASLPMTKSIVSFDGANAFFINTTLIFLWNWLYHCRHLIFIAILSLAPGLIICSLLHSLRGQFRTSKIQTTGSV